MGYAHRVEPGQQVKLDDVDPSEDAGLSRTEGEKKTAGLVGELIELQELLYAARRQSVLVILQGRDASGKDGAIRRVAGPLNAQGCAVVSFKAPTEDERAHDFLWRVHAHTPPAGHIRIFNRSHYEDVLVVRVHRLAADEVWRPRYQHINAFEGLLADAATIVLKFFLHISKEEQEHRLLAREKDPLKAWKLSVTDWEDRKRWDDYTAAYEAALTRCSTEHAPWFIVPADKKWFRDLAVAEAVRDALLPFRKAWLEKLDGVWREKTKVIEDHRRSH